MTNISVNNSTPNISIKQITPHITIRASGKEGPQGEKGDTGATGPQGTKGDPGDTGPQGEQGPAGDDGSSAYEIAVTNGFVGDEADWLASLVGADGADGDSQGWGKISGDISSQEDLNQALDKNVSGKRSDTLVSNYPTSFTHLENFNTPLADYYGAGTVALDSTITVDGGGSAKLTLASTSLVGGIRDSYATAQDWSNKNFSIWVRSSSWSQVSEIQLLLLSGGSYSDGNCFRLNIKQYLVAPTDDEWIQLIFNREQFVAVGSADWTDIQKIIVRGNATSGNTPSVFFDQFTVFEQATNGYLSIDFDDGWESIYTAANYMSTKGLVGAVHIIPELLGTAGYMTQEQVDDLARRGWDVSAHGLTQLGALTPAQREADLLAQRRYFDQHSYKGSDIYAYPEGVNNLAIRNQVGKYFSIGRDVVFISQPSAWVSPMNVHAFAPIESTTVSDITDRIDDTLDKGTWQVLTFHKIVNTPASGSVVDYATEDFEAVIDHIVSSGAVCLPKSQVIARLGAGGATQSSSSYTPSPVDTYDPYAAIANRMTVVEDFLNTATGSVFGTVVSGTQANAVAENPFTYDGVGIIRLTTGNTATGSAYVGTAPGTSSAILFGGSGLTQKMKLRCQIGALATTTEDFTVRHGFLDSGSGESTDGAYFEYDRSLSANWQIVTANNGTRTKTDTSVAVDTGYHTYEVIVNGGTASFYIDGTNVGSQSTNVPFGSNRSVGVGGGLLKRAGTGYSYYRVDYIAVDATISR